MSAGPIERRWYSRLHFRVLGVWPQRVVDERLARLHAREMEHRAALQREDDATRKRLT